MSSLLLELALRSGFSTADVSRIVESGPKRYKVYEIPKRSGGYRTIAQPSRELKAVQRVLASCFLDRFSVHENAAAYAKGRSIRANAERHVGERAIIKLDFKDFFTSIKPNDLLKFLYSRDVKASAADSYLILQTLFWGKGAYQPSCLSVGAPTSPQVSNILMYDIDQRATEIAHRLGIKYTRYADDITASGRTKELLIRFEKEFRRVISDAPFPRLRFNNKKRGLYVRGQKQMVTGLVLTPSGEISIGRERKRRISAMIHRASVGELSVVDLTELKGLLAFVTDCEPAFLERLKRKYGGRVIEEILTR